MYYMFKYKYIYTYIYIYIYITLIMKKMYPPGYYRNGFMETHALIHMIHGYILSILMNQRLLNKLRKERNICLYILNMIYMYIYIYIYIYM